MVVEHYAGKSQSLRLTSDVVSTAIYGGDNKCYRYQLERLWDKNKPLVMWILMNPSVATEYEDDRTIAKCQRYSREWGYGGMLIGNSFAYRCTDQQRLKEICNPIGDKNDYYLLKMAQKAKLIILAMGTPKIEQLQSRSENIIKLLRKNHFQLYSLKLSKRGRPMHPLYLSSKLKPIPFN